MKYAIIQVETQTDKLHYLDHGVAGTYGVQLEDDAQPRNEIQEDQDPLEEAALDEFHDSVAIKVLDDFEITVTIKDSVMDCPDDVEWL